MPQLPDRPNVLLIMTDQHRADCIGAAGNEYVRTPNLDRLAARGVLLRRCFTNCPVCAPARIALASGLQPGRVGALGNDAYLPRSTPTYYQRLRDEGYRVGSVGKLDLAKPDPYNGRFGDRPCNFGWGFTHPCECEGKMHAGRGGQDVKGPLGPYNFYLREKGLLKKFCDDYDARAAAGWAYQGHWDSVLDTEDWEDCYIGRKAAEWIRDIPDDFPWHYFVSFVGPHDPFDPPTEYADRWRDAPVPEAIGARRDGRPNSVKKTMRDFDPEIVAVTRRQYYASIECIDDQIGLILDALEARGQLDDTYIIFTSDHGEMLGDHGRYTKGVMYEGSMAVPLIAAGPGIDGGRVTEALVELIDVNATICELAGLAPQQRIDAQSFAPLLLGRTDRHRDCVYSEICRHRALRTARYKYIANVNDTPELYDLQEDPDELTNIAADRPDILADFRQMMSARHLDGQWRR